MSRMLSRSDIRFLEIFYKIGAVLAIVPSYSFEESRLLHPKFAKFQSTIYTVVFIITSCFSLHARRQHHESFFTPTQQVLDYFNVFGIVAVAATAMLSSCHLNQNKWLLLNNGFQNIDKRLGTRNCTVPLRKSANFQLVSWHVGFTIIEVFMCGVPLSLGGWKYFCTYLISNVCAYYYFFAQILSLNIVAAVKQRYKILNGCLVDINNKNSEKQRDVVSGLREIGVSLRMLSEMVQLFNDIFGFVYIFMVLVNGTNILLCVSFSLSNNLGKIKLPIEFYSQLTAVIGGLLIMGSTSVVIMFCDFAKKESQETCHLCYKLQEQLPVDSEEREELLRLAKTASNSVARFTAADFFELNRSTLCTILGTTTTYLIVMIQFSNNKNFS